MEPYNKATTNINQEGNKDHTSLIRIINHTSYANSSLYLESSTEFIGWSGITLWSASTKDNQRDPWDKKRSVPVGGEIC